MSDEELEFFSHLTRLCPEDKLTVPFLIYSFSKKKPVCVIYYLQATDTGSYDALESWLKNCQIELFKFYSVKDLYLNDDFMDAIKR